MKSATRILTVFAVVGLAANLALAETRSHGRSSRQTWEKQTKVVPGRQSPAARGPSSWRSQRSQAVKASNEQAQVEQEAVLGTVRGGPDRFSLSRGTRFEFTVPVRVATLNVDSSAEEIIDVDILWLPKVPAEAHLFAPGQSKPVATAKGMGSVKLTCPARSAGVAGGSWKVQVQVTGDASRVSGTARVNRQVAQTQQTAGLSVRPAQPRANAVSARMAEAVSRLKAAAGAAGQPGMSSGISGAAGGIGAGSPGVGGGVGAGSPGVSDAITDAAGDAIGESNLVRGPFGIRYKDPASSSGGATSPSDVAALVAELQQMRQRMDRLEREVAVLKARLNQNSANASTWNFQVSDAGTPDAMEANVGDLANVDLQKQLQKQTQTQQMMSNILKTMKDTARTAIRNIK